jgi:hypothetical protein
VVSVRRCCITWHRTVYSVSVRVMCGCVSISCIMNLLCVSNHAYEPQQRTTTHAAKQKSVHLTTPCTPLSVVAFLPSDGSGLVVEGHSACVGVGLRRYGRGGV